MAAKPHVVRNGYIALRAVDNAVMKAWRGDVVDVPAAWVDALIRQGVISEDFRVPADGFEGTLPELSPHEPPIEPEPPAELVAVSEPEGTPESEAAGEPAGDEPAAEDAPAHRRRGRPRKADGGTE